MRIGEPVISRERIDRRVKELAKEIESDYGCRQLALLGVLNGSVCFVADLMREISLDLEVYFVRLSSYQGTQPSKIDEYGSLDIELSGKHILVVEDIVDTGATANLLLEKISKREPKSVAICSLLEKPSRKVYPVDVRYSGFMIRDKFVVGYGMDYNGLYRNLANIVELSE